MQGGLKAIRGSDYAPSDKLSRLQRVRRQRDRFGNAFAWTIKKRLELRSVHFNDQLPWNSFSGAPEVS
jgi:hypothetical protein